MKKTFFRGFILLLVCVLMAGCGNGSKSEDEKKQSRKIEFETKNLSGEDRDTGIFENYSLTMINIWGTYCGPCKEEMPMLQEIYSEMRDKGVNLIGIVSDGETERIIKVAKDILAASGVEFENIVPDEKLINGIFEDVQGVPTTFFVDSKGNILGDEILGAVSKEDYIAAIESRLEGIDKK